MLAKQLKSEAKEQKMSSSQYVIKFIGTSSLEHILTGKGTIRAIYFVII